MYGTRLPCWSRVLRRLYSAALRLLRAEATPWAGAMRSISGSRGACGWDLYNGLGRPGAAGGGRPPAPPAPLPVGRCGRDRQRAGLFLGQRDVPFPAGEDGLDSLLHLLGEQALGPGRQVQLRGDPELLGAGHAELAQGVDGGRGADVAQAGEHLLSNAEMLA